jgi:hypothetical protein
MRVLRVAELAAAEAETRELIVVVACWWWCMVWSSFYDGIPLEVFLCFFLPKNFAVFFFIFNTSIFR